MRRLTIRTFVFLLLPVFLSSCGTSSSATPIAGSPTPTHVPLAKCRPADYTESWTMRLDFNDGQTMMGQINVMYASQDGLHIRVYPYTSLNSNGLPIHDNESTDLEIVWRCEGDRNHIVALRERRVGDARTVEGYAFPDPIIEENMWDWLLEYSGQIVPYRCNLVSPNTSVAQGYSAAVIECKASNPDNVNQPFIDRMVWYVSSSIRLAGFEIEFNDGTGIRATIRAFESVSAPSRILPR